MKVKLKVYDGVKYNVGTHKVDEIEYEINGFKVVTGDQAAEIVNASDGSIQDEYNEYLVLDLGNNKTATFCNSHVDMFRMQEVPVVWW